MRDEDLKELVNKPRRELGEFRVGDVVTCMKEGVYSLTDVGVRCKVVNSFPRQRDNQMRVKIISNGEEWIVDKEHFEILEESQA